MCSHCTCSCTWIHRIEGKAVTAVTFLIVEYNYTVAVCEKSYPKTLRYNIISIQSFHQNLITAIAWISNDLDVSMSIQSCSGTWTSDIKFSVVMWSWRCLESIHVSRIKSLVIASVAHQHLFLHAVDNNHKMGIQPGSNMVLQQLLVVLVLLCSGSANFGALLVTHIVCISPYYVHHRRWRWLFTLFLYSCINLPIDIELNFL